jgi:hypothetical protein
MNTRQKTKRPKQLAKVFYIAYASVFIDACFPQNTNPDPNSEYGLRELSRRRDIAEASLSNRSNCSTANTCQDQIYLAWNNSIFDQMNSNTIIIGNYERVFFRNNIDASSRYINVANRSSNLLVHFIRRYSTHGGRRQNSAIMGTLSFPIDAASRGRRNEITINLESSINRPMEEIPMSEERSNNYTHNTTCNLSEPEQCVGFFYVTWSNALCRNEEAVVVRLTAHLRPNLDSETNRIYPVIFTNQIQCNQGRFLTQLSAGRYVVEYHLIGRTYYGTSSRSIQIISNTTSVVNF